MIEQYMQRVLERENKSAIYWFKINDMKVSPDKFQLMIMGCNKKENKYDFKYDLNIKLIHFICRFCYIFKY